MSSCAPWLRTSGVSPTSRRDVRCGNQRGSVERRCPVGRFGLELRAKLGPVDLPQMGAREGVPEDHFAWMFVRLEARAAVGLEFLGKRVIRTNRDDERMRLGQPIGIHHAYHCDLPDAIMFEQTPLHLLGGKPLTANLQQIVGSPAAVR